MFASVFAFVARVFAAYVASQVIEVNGEYFPVDATYSQW